MKWNAIHQHFLRDPVNPVDGLIHAPDEPGFGMELDPAKMETDAEIFA